jgi:hypothetical protein
MAKAMQSPPPRKTLPPGWMLGRASLPPAGKPQPDNHNKIAVEMLSWGGKGGASSWFSCAFHH